jgi:magnesium transporter
MDTVVGWGRYVDGLRCDDARFDEALALARAGDGFLWVAVHAPNMRQISLLGEVFGLHPLTVEDAANVRQRPKLERHEGMLFLAMRTLAYVEHDARADGGDVVETGSVVVLVGDRFVVTVRHGRRPASGARHPAPERETLRHGPSAVLHAVVDRVVDDYLEVVDAVNDDIEEIENEVFASRTPSNIERIYQLKRDVIEMKRTVTALAGPVHELANRSHRQVHPEIQGYLRDASDHLDRVREHVASFDELLSSILQAALARLSVSENEDMRRISAWVTIAAVPTMIAGIYGMNFAHMPELSQRWGYPAVLAGMAVICGSLYRGFRRNGWL